jgi:hypothetical protein
MAEFISRPLVEIAQELRDRARPPKRSSKPPSRDMNGSVIASMPIVYGRRRRLGRPPRRRTWPSRRVQ